MVNEYKLKFEYAVFKSFQIKIKLKLFVAQSKQGMFWKENIILSFFEFF